MATHALRNTINLLPDACIKYKPGSKVTTHPVIQFITIILVLAITAEIAFFIGLDVAVWMQSPIH